ncbi:FecR family protein [Brevundimonas pondensis]|uniref:FecR domain-containing protein n=1 Tax=Brevundimonas pondensis TaxID=2774189 RepID=A0ABX7SMA0_9CAUL|nr:FecR domain-containing protein [Brevundimonas pondensis]QTC87450.1 FecR domain-containing protein [Brevundimonas pondensis]
MSMRNTIEDTAAHWLIRAADGLSGEDQTRLEAWLDAAPEHRTAYWRLEYSWEKAGRLAALRSPETLAEAVATPPAPRRRVTPRWAIGLAAGLAAVALATTVLWPRPASYVTDTGEQRLVALSDGSRVELNTETRLRASISADGREAWLDQGEAYFEVAHDASRPFTVHMGDRTVNVLGTRFSVKRDGDTVRVIVAEGRVRLSGPQTAHAPKPVILVHGDVATGDGRSILQSHTSAEKVQDHLAWRRGLLVFDQITLSDAAAEFNRYNETQLVVGDARTAEIRIGGSFEAANVEAFVRLLRSAYGLEIVRDGEIVKISE